MPCGTRPSRFARARASPSAPHARRPRPEVLPRGGDVALNRQLGLALGATCIAFAPVFVKSLGTLGPTTTGAYRMATGAVVLYGMALAGRARMRRRPPEAAPRPGPLVGWGLVAGVLFALDLYVWHRSVLIVGAGMGTILGNTQVFYLGLVGLLFLREGWSWRYGVSVPLAFAGIVLLVGVDAPRDAPVGYGSGVAYGLATGVVYATFLLVLRRLQSRTTAGPVLILAVISTVAALVLTAVALAEGTLRAPRPGEIVFILGLALVPQVTGWYLISRNLPHVELSRSGLILLLQPALATLFGALWFAERLAWPQVVGAGVTLAAIYLGSTRALARRAPA